MFDFYVCSVVGGTRYLAEWLEAVKKLKPSKIVIARDLSRSEPLTIEVETIDYDTKIPWEGYEMRHLRWESDKSILVGFIKLLEDFIQSNQSHFIHIDSDIILSDEAIQRITSKSWDYLQLATRDLPRPYRVDNPQWKNTDWHKHLVVWWESTNLGLSRRLAELVLPSLKDITDPFPVDINIHKAIREKFRPDKVHLTVYAKIKHYIGGEGVILS